MGVIKVNISKVYAKAQDRNSVHLYKKNVRTKPNLQSYLEGVTSGNSSLVGSSSKHITLYSTQSVQIPEKTYNTVRLVLLHTIPKIYPNMTKEDFCIYFCKKPHQLLKYHVIASGARADRTSQGMRRAFGTPFMKCCKTKEKIFPFLRIHLSSKYEKNIKLLKEVLFKAKCKLPFKGFVIVEENLDNKSIVEKGKGFLRNQRKNRIHRLKNKS